MIDLFGAAFCLAFGAVVVTGIICEHRMEMAKHLASERDKHSEELRSN